MEALHQLESKLAGLMKDAPKLSDSTKKSLADIWPWLALVFGVLQLFAAYWLYGTLSIVNNAYVRFAEALTGQTTISAFDKLTVYALMAVLVVDAVILLMAFPKLKRREKSGWDLLFLGVVVNAVYGVFSIFRGAEGFMNLIFSLIGSLIAYWLLYQVKELYKDTTAPKS